MTSRTQILTAKLYKSLNHRWRQIKKHGRTSPEKYTQNCINYCPNLLCFKRQIRAVNNKTKQTNITRTKTSKTKIQFLSFEKTGSTSKSTAMNSNCQQ